MTTLDDYLQSALKCAEEAIALVEVSDDLRVTIKEPAHIGSLLVDVACEIRAAILLTGGTLELKRIEVMPRKLDADLVAEVNGWFSQESRAELATH